jgi:hypothetical protein
MFGKAKIDGKNWEMLDFFKIPAISTIVGRTSTPSIIILHLAPKVNRQFTQKNRLTAIS